jgi:L-aminopeptidase/D-esterase-like protein
VARVGDLAVAALIAVNAVGDVDDGSTMAEIAAGTFEPPQIEPFVDDDGSSGAIGAESPGENTTIGVIATNGILTKVGCQLVAQSAHDGLARALVPSHSIGDGDAIVAAATGLVEADLSTVRLLAVAVAEAAVRSVDSTDTGPTTSTLGT